MNNSSLKKNLPVLLISLIVASFVYTGAIMVRNSNLGLMNADDSSAQTTTCTQADTNSFQIVQPQPNIGDTFVKDCIAVGKQIYTNDVRFTFFDVSGGLLPVGKPYIRTQNVATKNASTNYSWGINVTNSAGAYVYVYQRRTVDTSTLLGWMNTTNPRFVKVSPDGFSSSQLNQFLLRRNATNLTGVYDVYRTQTPVTGQINLGPASTANDNALSMYIAAVLPQTGGGQPTSPPNNPTNPPNNPTNPPNNATNPPNPTLPPGGGAIVATVETKPVPHGGDAADDPAIWVNTSNPGGSLVLGTDKAGGGIRVYNMSGAEINKAGDGRQLNNVDIRNGFNLGGQSITVAAASDKGGPIGIFRLNSDGSMVDIASGNLNPSFDPYGFCLYKSPTGKLYGILTSDNAGIVQQYELVANSSGKVDAIQVTRTVPFSGSGKITSQSEGCFADDELGFIYIGEETKGVWKFGAEPNSTVNPSSPIMPTGTNIKADIEGVSVVKTGSGTGFIMVSSQGDNSFGVYRREGNNAFVKKFTVGSGTIDNVTGSDGVDSVLANLGNGFSNGLFVTQDTKNDGTGDAGGNQNFKYVPLERILGGL
jgi:myo-inositol-hexaphosphate 3-phosphohydrolase